ncbi:MAG: hypothetical protein KC416_14040, partial [Myxococcales bacterium]|nr:hypothetical protein [Myxococcales bacterium]
VGGVGAVYIFLMYSIQAVFIVLAGVIPLYAMRIPFASLLRVGETVYPPAPTNLEGLGDEP